MKAHSRPHPVLSPGTNDVLPNDCALMLKHGIEGDQYVFVAGIAYSNPTLSQLVTEGRAIEALHIECRTNFFREVVKLTSPEHRFAISTQDVLNTLELQGFILATSALSGLHVHGAHEDFGNAAFDVMPGDVLAMTTPQKLFVSLDYDRNPSLGSILTIVCASDDQDFMSVNTDGDHIVATLSKDDYKSYTMLRKDPSFRSIVVTHVATPALLTALHDLSRMDKDNAYEEAMAERRWLRTLHNKLQSKNIDLRSDEPSDLEKLQILLDMPLGRTLRELGRLDDEGASE